MEYETSSKKLENICHALEKTIVQGQSQQSPLFCINITCDIDDLSTLRAEYFSEQFKFAFTLVKISVLLINSLEDKDSTLKAYIQHLDS